LNAQSSGISKTGIRRFTIKPWGLTLESVFLSNMIVQIEMILENIPMYVKVEVLSKLSPLIPSENQILTGE
jgi:hypothetical protein